MVRGVLLCPGQQALKAGTAKVVTRGTRTSRLATVSYANVRPYTIRKGDTLQSIATKREINPDDIVHFNHDINLSQLAEGQTILIPSGKLSSRDKEILDGIGPKSYRLYPVRKDESVADIMAKRGIKREEMQALNPGVNLDKIKEHQVLKLPSNKFTIREKEMLAGTGLVPMEFFSTSKPFGLGIVGALVIAAVVAYFARAQGEKDED